MQYMYMCFHLKKKLMQGWSVGKNLSDEKFPWGYGFYTKFSKLSNITLYCYLNSSKYLTHCSSVFSSDTDLSFVLCRLWDVSERFLLNNCRMYTFDFLAEPTSTWSSKMLLGWLTPLDEERLLLMDLHGKHNIVSGKYSSSSYKTIDSAKVIFR